ncbi:hypothetical protein CJ177_34290 [Rhodococcus sp. ACPA1]|nr:hypothetical protein CJ177_34290 [Rhodococcus sp. ACPA1]
MNSRQYRQWRQGRHATWIKAQRKRKHPDTEADLIIAFAIMWAPYGGAPAEEILVRFGLTGSGSLKWPRSGGLSWTQSTLIR